MNISERYEKVIREVFEIASDVSIDKNMTRENTEKWDSLVHLTLVAALEDEFDLMLDTEDILSLNSYQNGLEIVQRNTEV